MNQLTVSALKYTVMATVGGCLSLQTFNSRAFYSTRLQIVSLDIKAVLLHMKLIYSAVGMCELKSIFQISLSYFLSLCPSESMPDLLTAVKILAGSTVEIAAASVGERSLLKAVRKIEEDGKGLDSLLEVVEPEILEAITEAVVKEAAEEGTVVVNEEELKSAEADAEAPAAEEETSAPVAAAEEEEQEEAAASLPEEPTTSAPSVEEVGDAEAEDQAPVTAAETSADEAAAEAPAEEPVEAAAVVDTVQLAAASTGSDLEVLSAAEPESTPEAPVHEAKSCHSARSATEEVAPPVALGGQLVSEGAMDIMEAVSQSKNILYQVNTPYRLYL